MAGREKTAPRRGLKEQIAIITYGCTLNQADSDIIKGTLEEKGYEISGLDCADVIVVNTCTVKGAAENKALERIRKLETGRRKLVIAGCMAADSRKLRKITGAPIVWPGALSRINDAVQDALCGRMAEYREPEGKDCLPRKFTKPIMRIGIAEGCTGACTFCQTKLARPGLRSSSPQKILAIAQEAIGRGAKEIQLTAMDTGAYGIDIGANLPDLLDCMNGLEGDFLVRLGMINPNHAMRMKDRLITAMKGQHIYKFLHTPVQAGSEKVCRDMGRAHTVAGFESLVADFRRHMPGITIATDIIVGFPTETEGDFQCTLKLLERVKPDVVNLSRFSPRPGTAAEKLPRLPDREIKRRSRLANELVSKIREGKDRAHIGKEYSVLITEKGKGYKGRTGDYTQVVVRDFSGELGDCIKVKVAGASRGTLLADYL